MSPSKWHISLKFRGNNVYNHNSIIYRIMNSIFAKSIAKAGVRAFSTEVRPFQVLGLQQVALGHTDKQQLSNFWVDLMGVPKVHTFQSEKENVDEDILSMGKVRVSSA
jgi:hypothetical protein